MKNCNAYPIQKSDFTLNAQPKILNGEFDIHGLYDKTDEEVIECLSKLDGIVHGSGRNARVIFPMQRPDILL